MRSIILLFCLLLTTSVDLAFNSSSIGIGTNSYTIDSEIASLPKIYSTINNFNRDINNVCPKGTYPLFNTIGYNCKVELNNKFISDFNSKAMNINSMIVNNDGIVILRSQDLDTKSVIQADSAIGIIGVNTYRENLFGSKLYTDANGYKYIYLKTDLYQNINNNIIALDNFAKNSMVVDIKVDSIEGILAKAIFGREYTMNTYTIPNEQLDYSLGYIYKEQILDYSLANWDMILQENERLLGGSTALNNYVRAIDFNFIESALPDLKITTKLVAQIKDN